MIMYNGVAVFKLRVEWQCTLKERRQVSQKVRDHIKNQFNASVKLDYEEDAQIFYCVVSLLGESDNYIDNQLRYIEDYLEMLGEITYTCEVSIDRV